MTKKSSKKGFARRRGAPLGQHFLTRPETAAWVAEAAGLKETDTVLEIGPGHGILTRELLQRAGSVIAVEKDPTLVTELQSTFCEELNAGKLTIVPEDIRDFGVERFTGVPYKLVANIPYYLTGYILRRFLTADVQPESITVLMQKEVAERIVAKEGKESLLSLSVKAFGTPRYAHTVKAGAFAPPPNVDSAILHVAAVSRAHFRDERHEQRFFELTNTAFRQKRKRLGHTLGTHVPHEVFAGCGIDPEARPETLTLKEWLCLSAAACAR